MCFAKNHRHFCMLLLWKNVIELLIEYVKDAAHYLTYSGNRDWRNSSVVTTKYTLTEA